MTLRVARDQLVAYRLLVNHLTVRLPVGAYAEAARFALQDSAPRSALLSLHARVDGCEPSAWSDPRLLQTYSPRAAVHVVPLADFGIFTIGRLPSDPETRQAIESAADQVCAALDGGEVRARDLPPHLGPSLRLGAASGRIALRWTTSALYAREIPAPAIDPEVARHELCRRHVQAFGPTTPAAFAWWAGLPKSDANEVWLALEKELLPVECGGEPSWQSAWILAAAEPLMRSAPPMRGVRFLPGEEWGIFGKDRTGMFVGPGNNGRSPLLDWYHPHGLVVDGTIVGTWGRRGGRVQVKLRRSLAEKVGTLAETRAAIEAEGLSLPIPGARMAVEIQEFA
ncbi:DNA glycosylase AlkZ-like family protein [Actinopolymorpha alba]|uniref:DNA glycosylase AlkZ-like family protein n=1 Tax=Actinopolymorpha alba TaxID=533267 RepID=UPI00037F587F|nr:crosslink repair DNA glycosylase YcaQ family protein [Actinopolymorpha alba]